MKRLLTMELVNKKHHILSVKSNMNYYICSISQKINFYEILSLPQSFYYSIL